MFNDSAANRSGLAFFGTPHNGARMSLVKLASVAARLASKVRMQPENDVPEAIRDGSLYTEILKEHWRQRLLDFDLISFYESDEKVSRLIRLSVTELHRAIRM